MSVSEARLQKLRELVAARGLDALLVTNLVNVRYLSGFTGTNAALMVSATEAVLLTDFRYLEQAAAQASAFEVVDGGREPRKLLAARMPPGGTVGFDDAHMNVQSHRAWLDAVGESAELVAASGIPESMRAVKDAGELDLIAKAARIADSIYETLASEGLGGRTESDVAWRITELAHERGGQGLSFPPIVAAGAHGALPHAEPRDHPIVRGDLVVLDLGVIVEGYCSDATRTFSVGEPSSSARDVYELVLTAQRAALSAVVAGGECKAVDAAAREVIDAAGYGERFGHSTGHGVGLEVHELPTLSARSDAVLATCNVVTVEPGVYLPGEFGVRIEDLVVVEEGGPRVLSEFTKSLTVVD